MNTQDIRKLQEQDKLIIGFNNVRQAVQENKTSQVLIASNAEVSRSERMNQYCSLSDISAENVDLSNQQLGTACRKPFSISFLAVKA
jgi:ribosomal protein L30E